MERPEEVEETAMVAGEAAAAFIQLQHENHQAQQDGLLGADWGDVLDGTLAEGGRTSLIVNPSNGRLPPLTSQAMERQAEGLGRWLRPAHGPEDRLLSERCIIYKSAPLGWSISNNNLQIFQTQDTIVVLHEMIHEAVIVSLNERPPLPPTLRQWGGDARGYWEGDTLVIETTNRHSQWLSMNGFVRTPNMRVIERFTRIDTDTLHYQFTVDDPETYMSSWTAEWPMRRTDEPIFEYACHEGNRSMATTLAGARAVEREDVP